MLQVGRAAFLIVVLRGRALGEHFVNDLIWELLTGVLWVAGAIADGDARLVLWGLAVVAAHCGAWALHWLPGRGQRVDLGHTEIAGGHLVERFAPRDRCRGGRDRRGRRRHRVGRGTWTLTLMVLALIGIAVGDELAIAHPGADATLGFTILTFGGPALFLLAQVVALPDACCGELFGATGLRLS